MLDLKALTAQAERLLASDRLTTPTRAALRQRLSQRHAEPKVLNPAQMRTLRAVSARLIPAPELAQAIDLAGAFDAALAQSSGDGWRYANLPPDRMLHPLGLNALEAEAQNSHALDFDVLADAQQDALLQSVADGRLALRGELDSARWFEELLSLLVELHYAHPLVQLVIGYDGMADAKGHQAVSLAAIAREAAVGG